jgi:hypothetical protein
MAPRQARAHHCRRASPHAPVEEALHKRARWGVPGLSSLCTCAETDTVREPPIALSRAPWGMVAVW